MARSDSKSRKPYDRYPIKISCLLIQSPSIAIVVTRQTANIFCPSAMRVRSLTHPASEGSAVTRLRGWEELISPNLPAITTPPNQLCSTWPAGGSNDRAKRRLDRHQLNVSVANNFHRHDVWPDQRECRPDHVIVDPSSLHVARLERIGTVQ